jgi:hypothetical protein
MCQYFNLFFVVFLFIFYAIFVIVSLFNKLSMHSLKKFVISLCIGIEASVSQASLEVSVDEGGKYGQVNSLMYYIVAVNHRILLPEIFLEQGDPQGREQHKNRQKQGKSPRSCLFRPHVMGYKQIYEKAPRLRSPCSGLPPCTPLEGSVASRYPLEGASVEEVFSGRVF